MRYLLRRVELLRVEWERAEEERQRTLHLRRAKIKDRLANLTDALLDGLIDKELFEERKRALLAERANLDDRLARGEEDRSMPDKVQEFLELAESAKTTYEKANPEEKREFLLIFTSNRTVKEKKPMIVLKEPFRLIAERARVPNGGPSRARPRILEEVLAGVIAFARQEEQ